MALSESGLRDDDLNTLIMVSTTVNSQPLITIPVPCFPKHVLLKYSCEFHIAFAVWTYWWVLVIFYFFFVLVWLADQCTYTHVLIFSLLYHVPVRFRCTLPPPSSCCQTASYTLLPPSSLSPLSGHKTAARTPIRIVRVRMVPARVVPGRIR